MLVTSATLTRAQRDIVMESLNLSKESTILLDAALDRPNLYFCSLPLGIGVRCRVKRGTPAVQCSTPLDHLVDTLVDKETGDLKPASCIPKTIVYFDSIATLNDVAKHLRALLPNHLKSKAPILIQPYFSSRSKSSKLRIFDQFL